MCEGGARREEGDQTQDPSSQTGRGAPGGSEVNVGLQVSLRVRRAGPAHGERGRHSRNMHEEKVPDSTNERTACVPCTYWQRPGSKKLSRVEAGSPLKTAELAFTGRTHPVRGWEQGSPGSGRRAVRKGRADGRGWYSVGQALPEAGLRAGTYTAGVGEGTPTASGPASGTCFSSVRPTAQAEGKQAQ